MKKLLSFLFCLLSFNTLAFSEACDGHNTRQVSKIRYDLTMNLEKIDLNFEQLDEEKAKENVQKFLRRIDHSVLSLRQIEEKKICNSLKKSARAVLILIEKRQKALESYFLGLSARPKFEKDLSKIQFQDV